MDNRWIGFVILLLLMAGVMFRQTVLNMDGSEGRERVSVRRKERGGAIVDYVGVGGQWPRSVLVTRNGDGLDVLLRPNTDQDVKERVWTLRHPGETFTVPPTENSCGIRVTFEEVVRD